MNPDILDSNNRSRFQALARTAGERGHRRLVRPGEPRDHRPRRAARSPLGRARSRSAIRGSTPTPRTRSGTRRTRSSGGAHRSTPLPTSRSSTLPRRRSARPTRRRRSCSGRRPATTTPGSSSSTPPGLRSASFDAAAVHTDTACLTSAPDSFYRDGGRLAQFTFLGYREVLASMAARGDGGKPIWMTELGWTSTGGASGPLCASGTWAGQKPAGVTQAQQARVPRDGLPLPRAGPGRAARHVVHAARRSVAAARRPAPLRPARQACRRRVQARRGGAQLRSASRDRRAATSIRPRSP